MDNINEDNHESEELHRSDSRRQRKQLRFSEEEKQEKPPSTFKPPGRASRLLSICDPSAQLPGVSLLRLRQLHNQITNNKDSLISEEISDELLDKIPFRIKIIPDRRDDLIMDESSLRKSRQKNKDTMEIPTDIPSALSQERRLQIIEELLKDFNPKKVLDETRRSSAIPFRLPNKTQMQKNVTGRIRDLTGSEIIMLNDHMYMKNLCERLGEKHKEEVEANCERIASTEKHRQCFFVE